MNVAMIIIVVLMVFYFVLTVGFFLAEKTNKNLNEKGNEIVGWVLEKNNENSGIVYTKDVPKRRKIENEIMLLKDNNDYLDEKVRMLNTEKNRNIEKINYLERGLEHGKY